MDLTIEQKIAALSNGDRKQFKEELTTFLNDRDWCDFKGIDYVNPNIPKAREILYTKMFAQS